MRPTPRAVLLVALLALAVAGTAAAGNGGFAPVEPRSPNAEGITDAYYLILGLTAAVFVLVEGALIVFILRFRSRGRSRRVEGPQIRGNTRLELAWTVVPVLILAAIAAFVFVKLPGIENVPQASAGEALPVKVVAKQFYWQFEYPDGRISIDRMVVPVGRAVRLEVTAPNDVAHSWWIPALGGKIDAIPGRTNHTWFRASRRGVYRGGCAELCGIEHTNMTATVEVVSRSEYERFLGAHAPSSVLVGKEEFDGVCAKCHGLAGEGDIGPPIAGNALLTDAQGLKTLLEQGRGRMPAVGAGWSDAQVDALIAYAKSKPTLGGAQGGG